MPTNIRVRNQLHVQALEHKQVSPTANAPAKMTSISDFSPAYEDSIFLVYLEFIHPVSIEHS